jgi:hypothetical protein
VMSVSSICRDSGALDARLPCQVHQFNAHGRARQLHDAVCGAARGEDREYTHPFLIVLLTYHEKKNLTRIAHRRNKPKVRGVGLESLRLRPLPSVPHECSEVPLLCRWTCGHLSTTRLWRRL